MSRLLTLDLGLTTGWCVRNMDGSCIAAGHVEWPGEEHLSEMFSFYVQHYLPSYVAIEAPVLIARGELQGKLAMLIREAKNVYRTNTDWITPAQWKPRFRDYPLPEDVKLATQHAKDAYRIAQWWLITHPAVANVSST